MNRLKLVALLGTSVWSTSAFAQEPAEPDDTAEMPTDPEADAAAEDKNPEPAKPEPVIPSDEEDDEEAQEAPAAPVVAKPKIGDTTTSGYFRGGFGASSQKGRMSCFQLALEGGLLSKYRLGNECEVWAEYSLHTVVFAADSGAVANIHFTPTAFIPNTYIGYSPTGVTSSDLGSPGTGATVAFPNLYVDIKGIPWLFGGTAWAGTRYYKRESIYISDFFYWNPSGVGAGIEDVNVWGDIRVSYAAFAVDGQPSGIPQLPARNEFGIRNDFQVRGVRPFEGAELQLGFQYIADYSDSKDANGDSVTHGGWGVTFRYVQELLGGDNKFVVQYGKGGGTGFGTLSRFYYPDFSLRFDPAESRFRLLDVLTIQPLPWLGAQAAVVYQRDDLGTGQSGAVRNWYSAGARVSVAPLDHFKVLGELGYDLVKKTNGADPLYLLKATIAPALTGGRKFMDRPELRLFYTWARWSEAARGATIDSARLYTASEYLSGSIYGIQGETWW